MKKFCKRIPVLFLCCAMCITAVSAATSYSTWKTTTVEEQGVTYRSRSGIDSSVRGFTTAITANESAVDEGLVGARAILYYDDGSIATQSRVVYNQSVINGVTATSPMISLSGDYYARGEAHYWVGEEEYEVVVTNKTPTMQLARSVDETLDPMILEEFAEELSAVSVNESGETYGAAVLQDVIDLDLLSAVGINGQRGYIRAEDMPKAANSLEEARTVVYEDYYIPLYAEDGVTVIDSCLIGSGFAE